MEEGVNENEPLLTKHGCSKAVEAYASFEDAGYSYDYAIVFSAEESKLDARNKILSNLAKKKLNFFLYYSIDREEIICKIRASLPVLVYEGERANFKLLLDEQSLKEAAEAGYSDINGKVVINPIHIAHDPSITSLRPYQYIYAKVSSSSELWPLFATSENLQHPFNSKRRIKLILGILEAKGGEFNFAEMMKRGEILGHFALVDYNVVNNLYSKWIGCNPWSQPIDDIKEYLGEKIAIYFAFFGHYTCWLFVAGLVGLLVTIDAASDSLRQHTDILQALSNSWDIVFMCIFLSAWSQLLIVYWKRQASFLRMQWGTNGFYQDERERVEFWGEIQDSVITGKKVVHFHQIYRNLRICLSVITIAFLVCIVIFAILLVTLVGIMYGNIVGAVVNAVIILVLNKMYFPLAVGLSSCENYRTDSEFQDALVSKLFAFQFVNSYSSFFYVAFVATLLGRDCEGGCMQLLCIDLAAVFITGVVINLLTDLMWPMWMEASREVAGYILAKHMIGKLSLQYKFSFYLILCVCIYTVVRKAKVALEKRKSMLEERTKDRPQPPIGETEKERKKREKRELKAKNAKKEKEELENAAGDGFSPDTEAGASGDGDGSIGIAGGGPLSETEAEAQSPPPKKGLLSWLMFSCMRPVPLEPWVDETVEPPRVKEPPPPEVKLAFLPPVEHSWVDTAEDDRVSVSTAVLEEKSKDIAAITISKVEKEFLLGEYDPSTDIIMDYSTIAMQYGYCVLFVAAFPLAPLLGCIISLLEMRVDAYKLILLYRRPPPHVAEDVGTWIIMFQIIAAVAVITNAAIACFTMDIVRLRGPYLVWLFICVQYLIILSMTGFAYFVPATPLEVSIQSQRQQFIVEKVILRVPDVIEESLGEIPPYIPRLHNFDNDVTPQKVGKK